jgi:hypothetical protein
MLLQQVLEQALVRVRVVRQALVLLAQAQVQL